MLPRLGCMITWILWIGALNNLIMAFGVVGWWYSSPHPSKVVLIYHKKGSVWIHVPLVDNMYILNFEHYDSFLELMCSNEHVTFCLH
jgi:hypothetical protein